VLAGAQLRDRLRNDALEREEAEEARRHRHRRFGQPTLSRRTLEYGRGWARAQDQADLE
jgi:hypothetical protein